MKIRTKTLDVAGSHYEIGQVLGNITKEIPALQAQHTAGFSGFDKQDVKEAQRLFERWCPGLNEELHGFADALAVPAEQLLFYGMTSLRPNCSQIAVHPAGTEQGIPLVARNYEFSPEAEDFTLIRTSAAGKFTHLGTSVLSFGRDDGLNECGLSVTMSSCGFPVGPMESMRKPKVRGLQFWAVIRAILDTCQDVEEALDYIREMPVAYNINMMLADRSGRIALVETLDGRMAVKRLNPDEERYLCATNHPVLPELIPYEPVAMRHSLERIQWIQKTMADAGTVNSGTLKKMLLSDYPQGLCCHYFRDFFGTTKSMVISPAEGTVELCWGGEAQNGWELYHVGKSIGNTQHEIEIRQDTFRPEMAEYLTLTGQPDHGMRTPEK